LALLLVFREHSAQAAFADTTPPAAVQVTTATVAAPGDVSVSGSGCLLVLYTLHVSWPPSSARDVTGYRVTAYTGNGTPWVLGTAGPTETKFSVALGLTLPLQSYRYTVTTLTRYGWTAESPMAGPLYC